MLCTALLAVTLFTPLTATLTAPAIHAAPTPLYHASPQTTPFFVNISAEAGVSANLSILDPVSAERERRAGFMNGGRGACLVDINNDGRDDIYVVGPGKNQLFRNDGNFSFVDITDSAGVGDTGYGMACASGDLDNDGYQDIIVTNYYSHFILYRNNRNDTFTNMTAASGIDNVGPQTGIAIADFDNDGLLDFFITEYVKTSDRVYKNLGNWKFEDRSVQAHIADLDFGFQPIACDYDSDGNIDVYVVNDFGLDTLWRNIGNFTFADVSRVTGADDPGGGMGGAWGDSNGDGDFDIYVGNYKENGLWENRGGNFVNVANDSGVDDAWTTWGVVWLDYDNDGRMDIYAGNGNVEIGRDWYQPNKLFHNDGGNNFSDVSERSGAEVPEVTRGLVAGDLNGDGLVDLYLVNMNCPAMLLKNELSTSNNWLKVKLQGTVSNRDGVGAKVAVVTDGAAETQLVAAGSSYLSSNSKTLSFGLKNYTTASEVVVDWPSGLRQSVRSVSSNQTLTIVEEDKEDPVARAPDVIADQGVPFRLNGTASSDNVRVVDWQWTLNVNGTAEKFSGPLPLAVIYNPGSYQGRLDVRDLFNRSGSTIFNITVRPKAEVDLDAGPDVTVPEGALVNFHASGSSTVTPNFEDDCVFNWTFTDATGPVTLTGARPSYLFLNPGFYSVLVTVRDPQNATASDTLNVTVVDAMAPQIAASVPGTVDEDVQVTLDASATTDNDPFFDQTGVFTWSYASRAGPVVWSGARAFATFVDPGVFTLTLTVRDAAGNSAASNFTVTVRDTTAPTANAGPDVSVLPGQEVVLSASASTDNDPAFPAGGTFVWTVQGPSTSENFSGSTHVAVFSEPGIYRVLLDVWDPSGNHAPAPDTLYVRVEDVVKPTPDAGGDRVVNVGTPVALDASKSTDNDPALLSTGSFLWEFQDGAARRTLEGVTARYTFERAGTYNVRLTVTDQAGNSAAVVIKVAVQDLQPPVLSVVPLPSQIEAGSGLELNATGTTDNVGVASILWQIDGPFGFDAEVAGPTGRVILTIEGVYRVLLTARDAVGNLATASFNVTVVQPGGAGGPGGPSTPAGPGDPGAGGPAGPGPAVESPAGSSTQPLAAVELAAAAAAAAVLAVLPLVRRRTR